MRHAHTIKVVIAMCVVLAIFVVAGIAGIAVSGVYDVAATRQHSRLIFDTVAVALRRSVAHHANGIVVPELSRPGLATTGLTLYRRNCANCHGEPGLPPRPFAMGMTPVPPPIIYPARELPSNELFWVIKHGIKMTGMPAWQMKLGDAQIWSIVAFMKRLPDVSPEAYGAAVKAVEAGKDFVPTAIQPKSHRPAASDAAPVVQSPATPAYAKKVHAVKEKWNAVQLPLQTRLPEAYAPCFWLSATCGEKRSVPRRFGDPERGKLALRVFACRSCHVIGGMVGRTVRVGPTLTGLSHRAFLAGALANTPENAVRWITEPQSVIPGSAMPDMGVDVELARDMVAYLYGRSQ